MKKARKIFLISLGIIILGLGSVAAYFYFKESPKRDVMAYIPDDAIYIIETTDLTKGWSTLTESKLWQHMITNVYFEDIHESAALMDSLIKGDETLDMLFSNRNLYVSAHLLPENDFDFIFIIDLKQAGKFAFVKDYIGGITEQFGYTMERSSHEGTDILILKDKSSDDVFYISIIDNVFIASYSEQLLKNSIDAGKNPDHWTNNKPFMRVTDDLAGGTLFNLFVNYDFMSPYLAYYMSDQSDLLQSMKEIFSFSAFGIELNDERLSFSGNSVLKDSSNSYLHILSEVAPGPMQAYRIIPEDAALYLSISFAEYMNFFEKLKGQYTTQDSAGAEGYEKALRKMEKLFNIDLEQDFFSWIGNEIALVKLPPSPNARENDLIMTIHTKDIELAMSGLDNIMTKVKRRAPVKVSDSEYKNFEIHYFAIKGFFKMFFGKMFAKLDKPYYIFMDDFVVFSNSPSCLMDMIDSYERGRVLERKEGFMDFKQHFSEEANVTVFVQGPKIYSHLYQYAKADQKANIKENRELLVSFSLIGFQLTSSGKGYFENTLQVWHDADAMYNDELERIENAAEETYVSEFDSIMVLELPDGEDGKTMRIYWEEDSTIKAEGRIRDGKPDGMWRYYYESGNLWATVTYDEGEITGKAMLYHDEEEGKMKAQAEFEDGVMEGEYREFYSNGERKATIEFKDGKMDGAAEYYYDSGRIKIEGEYKEGAKTGKWKHYTETGDLMDREKYKRDQQRKKGK